MLAPFRWTSLTGIVGGEHIAPYRVADLANVRTFLADHAPEATVKREVDRVRIDVPKHAIGRLDALAARIRAAGVIVEPVTKRDHTRATVALHLVDVHPFGARLPGPVQP